VGNSIDQLPDVSNILSGLRIPNRRRRQLQQPL